jgi:hypothetical protein
VRTLSATSNEISPHPYCSKKSEPKISPIYPGNNSLISSKRHSLWPFLDNAVPKGSLRLEICYLLFAICYSNTSFRRADATLAHPLLYHPQTSGHKGALARLDGKGAGGLGGTPATLGRATPTEPFLFSVLADTDY